MGGVLHDSIQILNVFGCFTGFRRGGASLYSSANGAVSVKANDNSE